MTEVLDTNPQSIARAAACLRSGGLVAFPTETVYGLGAHALDRDAVRRLFEAKGRPANDPLIVHVLSFDAIPPLVRADLEVGPQEAGREPKPSSFLLAERLAARFWPGPLTLVLPKSAQVPSEVTAGLETVAIRAPAHPVARALLESARIPIAAPSANLFSRTSPTRADHVLEDLNRRIDLVIDGGPTFVGLESTVLDLTEDPPAVLRPGAVTIEMLRELLPAVRMSEAVPAGGPARSPGRLERHYAPRAPLTVYEGPGALDRLAVDATESAARGDRVAVLVPTEHVSRVSGPGVRVVDLGSSRDTAAIAARLYAALREADAGDVDALYALGMTDGGGLVPALRDRLRRAAAGRIIRT